MARLVAILENGGYVS